MTKGDMIRKLARERGIKVDVLVWPPSRQHTTWTDFMGLPNMAEPKKVEAKRGRIGGSRGWLYWLKRYRTGPGLDELNAEPLKVQMEWWRGSPCPNDDYVR